MCAQNYSQLSCKKFSRSIFSVKYNAKKVVFTILFSLYLALSIMRFIRPGFLITCMILGLGLFALILLSTKIRREYVSIYIYSGLLALSFLVSSLFTSRPEEVPRIFLHILSSTGIAMILLRGYVYSWGGYIVFYSLVGYFLMLMLVGVHPDSALAFTSWNGISMIMLIACISLYIILSMERKKIYLIPALFTLFISIWAIGRSGIVSSFVLLLGLLFVKIRAKPKYIYTVIICLFITYLFRGVLNMFAIHYIKVGDATDFFVNRLMVPSVRDKIWMNYFNNLDILRIIFGANVFIDPWPDKEILGYNYHNSFISLHAKTGFMGLITMVLIILSLFKFYKINKVFFFLLLVVILRWSTDYGIFFDSFDFIPFFFIFYFLKDFHFRKSNLLGKI